MTLFNIAGEIWRNRAAIINFMYHIYCNLYRFIREKHGRSSLPNMWTVSIIYNLPFVISIADFDHKESIFKCRMLYIFWTKRLHIYTAK